MTWRYFLFSISMSCLRESTSSPIIFTIYDMTCGYLVVLILQQSGDVLVFAGQYTNQLPVLHSQAVQEGLFKRLSHCHLIVSSGYLGRDLVVAVPLSLRLPFILCDQPLPHDLTYLEELSTIDYLVLTLLHLQIMQLHYLNKLLNNCSLVICLEDVLGQLRPLLYTFY